MGVSCGQILQVVDGNIAIVSADRPFAPGLEGCVVDRSKEQRGA
jgi:hypothetical protein